MPRLKGLRRACILVASILPLLADEPNAAAGAVVAGKKSAPVVEEQQHATDADDSWTFTATEAAAQRIMEDESLTRLPSLKQEWTTEDSDEFGQHFNHVVVGPYRPRPRGRRGNHTFQSTHSSDTKDFVSANGAAQSSLTKGAGSPGEEDETAVTRDDSAETSADAVTAVANNTTETSYPEEMDSTSGGSSNETAVDEPPGADPQVEPPKGTEDDDLDDVAVKSVKFDYASKSAGALILEKSSGWKGASNLLNNDNDRYAIIPCAETSKSVVMSLSEDILVKYVVLANYERFSSTVKDFQLLGSQTMGKWVDLGTYTAKHGSGKQEFELYEHSWARYLKFRVLSYYGNEHFLTISQISVFGDTMLQGFHEHWEEEQEEQEAEKETEEAPRGSDESEAHESGSETRASVSNAVDEEGSANAIEISQFTSNDPSTSELDSMCPKDLNFEQLVFLISANQSQFERMSFLSTSSASRSMSRYEHTDFPEINVLSMAPTSRIARATREASDDIHVWSTTEESSVSIDTKDSPVIAQIQSLIKSASGMDVDLSKINALFHGNEGEKSPPDEASRSEPATTEQETSETNDTDSKQSTEAADASPKEAHPSQRESKDGGRSAIMDTEEWGRLLKALERIPSSSCLKEIDFTEFRKRVASNKNGAAGQGNAHSSGASVELQPIFKRLTDEIKTLQGTLGIQEEFLKTTVSCYQKIMLDLVVQQEESQSRTEKRLEDLERAIQTYLMLLHFVEDCIAVIMAIVVSAFAKPWHLWFSDQLEKVPDTVLVILVAITTFFSCRMLFSFGWRWLKSKKSLRVNKGSKKTAQDHGDDRFFDSPGVVPKMIPEER